MNESIWVSLCYDGMYASHLNQVVPVLRELDFRACFTLTDARVLESASAWKEAIRAGHEVHNGCLLEAANPDGHLPLWTPEMILEDAQDTQALMTELFGASAVRLLCLPPGETLCHKGTVDYRPDVEARFELIRTSNETTNRVSNIRAAHLDSLAWSPSLAWPTELGTWTILRIDDLHPEELGAHLAFLQKKPETVEVVTIKHGLERLSLLPPNPQSSE